MFDQAEANRKKGIIQNKLVELHQQHDAILVAWCTGLGKSRAAGLCMRDKRVLLVHHQMVHRANWIEDLAKHDIGSDNIVFTTYAGIHKHASEEYDLLVMDECHHITPRNLKFLQTIRASKALYLSATVPYDKLLLLRQLSPQLKQFKVTLSEAIQQGILPKPSIFVKRLELNDSRADVVYVKGAKTAEIVHTDYFSYVSSMKYQTGKQFHVTCTRRQYYELLSEELEWYKMKYITENEKMLQESRKMESLTARRHFEKEWYRKNEWVKNRWLRLGSERKRFIGESKTEAVKQFLRGETGRLLIFAVSIDQCDELAGKHVVVHSKNKKDNSELVADFNEGRSNRLYSVSMLNEGMNLENLDKIYMVMLDGTKLSTVQKLGRSLRGTSPEIYIFLMSNTREEHYFSKFLEELDESLCEYI